MALNKKEKAYIEALENEIAKLKSEINDYPIVEKDVPIPELGDRILAKGWTYNLYNKSVYKTCSSSIHHGDGWEKTSSQNPISQYSSALKATIALREKIVEEYRNALSKIDKRIFALKIEEGNHE